jgi:hypothetical protein
MGCDGVMENLEETKGAKSPNTHTVYGVFATACNGDPGTAIASLLSPVQTHPPGRMSVVSSDSTTYTLAFFPKRVGPCIFLAFEAGKMSCTVCMYVYVMYMYVCMYVVCHVCM